MELLLLYELLAHDRGLGIGEFPATRRWLLTGRTAAHQEAHIMERDVPGTKSKVRLVDIQEVVDKADGNTELRIDLRCVAFHLLLKDVLVGTHHLQELLPLQGFILSATIHLHSLPQHLVHLRRILEYRAYHRPQLLARMRGHSAVRARGILQEDSAPVCDRFVLIAHVAPEAVTDDVATTSHKAAEVLEVQRHIGALHPLLGHVIPKKRLVVIDVASVQLEERLQEPLLRQGLCPIFVGTSPEGRSCDSEIFGGMVSHNSQELRFSDAAPCAKFAFPARDAVSGSPAQQEPQVLQGPLSFPGADLPFFFRIEVAEGVANLHHFEGGKALAKAKNLQQLPEAREGEGFIAQVAVLDGLEEGLGDQGHPELPEHAHHLDGPEQASIGLVDLFK
mmetsp:Transcript_28759/g.61095  ORF Transcript_28759/g.61095 Transcript_28759/m.61095 type:complete len:392 (+) Transcript_28759:210-1385(+)